MVPVRCQAERNGRPGRWGRYGARNFRRLDSPGSSLLAVISRRDERDRQNSGDHAQDWTSSCMHRRVNRGKDRDTGATVPFEAVVYQIPAIQGSRLFGIPAWRPGRGPRFASVGWAISTLAGYSGTSARSVQAGFPGPRHGLSSSFGRHDGAAGHNTGTGAQSLVASAKLDLHVCERASREGPAIHRSTRQTRGVVQCTAHKT